MKIGKLVLLLVIALALVALSGCNLGNSANSANTGTAVTPTPVVAQTPIPTASGPSGDPAWTTAWNVPYLNRVLWEAPYTCPPLHVCEWWDQKADGYDHEGFVITLDGESVDFPANSGNLLNPITYIGTSWEVKSNEEALRLITTYRHLVFYANQFDQAYWTEIFGAELYDRYLGGLVIEAKPQHFYMAEFQCDFKDQLQCAELDAKVRHLPNGINLNRDR